MTSNSSKMTLEERLVQHIKTTGFNILVDDEDAITELTRRAVEQALTQPRPYLDGGYSHRTQDSPVVAAARDIATKALQKLVDEEVEKIRKDPASMKAVREAMSTVMVQVLTTGVYNTIQVVSQNVAQDALKPLRDKGIL